MIVENQLMIYSGKFTLFYTNWGTAAAANAHISEDLSLLAIEIRHATTTTTSLPLF